MASRQSCLITAASAVTRNIDSSSYDNVKYVANNMEDVSTVAAAIDTDVFQTNADNISVISTVGESISDINSVADGLADIVNNIGSINLLAGDLSGSCISRIEDNGSITESIISGDCTGTSVIEEVALNIDNLNTISSAISSGTIPSITTSGFTIDDGVISSSTAWSSSKIKDYIETESLDLGSLN